MTRLCSASSPALRRLAAANVGSSSTTARTITASLNGGAKLACRSSLVSSSTFASSSPFIDLRRNRTEPMSTSSLASLFSSSLRVTATSRRRSSFSNGNDCCWMARHAGSKMYMHSKSDESNQDEEANKNSCSGEPGAVDAAAAATVAAASTPPTREKVLNKKNPSSTSTGATAPSSATASAEGGSSSVIVDNTFLHLFLPDRPGGFASLVDEKNRLFKSGSGGASSSNKAASSGGAAAPAALVFLNSHPSAPMTLGWHNQVESELIFPSSKKKQLQQQLPATNVENATTPENNNHDPSSRRRPEVIRAMNRNARRARRANHGKRPCSRIARRTKSRAIGRHRR